MDLIKVYNKRKYDIGLILANGTERVVHPGSFVMLSRNDIEFLMSIAPSLFEGEKQLAIEDKALEVQLGVIENEQEEILDAEVIRKKLAQRVGMMKVWLDAINEPYLLDAVYDVAVTMDLPASKLQVLQEKMPNREFITAQ